MFYSPFVEEEVATAAGAEGLVLAIVPELVTVVVVEWAETSKGEDEEVENFGLANQIDYGFREDGTGIEIYLHDESLDSPNL